MQQAREEPAHTTPLRSKREAWSMLSLVRTVGTVDLLHAPVAFASIDSQAPQVQARTRPGLTSWRAVKR